MASARHRNEEGSQDRQQAERISEITYQSCFSLVVAVGFAVSAIVVSIILGKTEANPPQRYRLRNAGWCPKVKPSLGLALSSTWSPCSFILFDLEIVFMYPWAVVYKEAIVHSKTISGHAQLRHHPDGRLRLRAKKKARSTGKVICR